MENSKLELLRGNDLDQLLKQAFVNQDFDQLKNSQMLDAVSHHVMTAGATTLLSFRKIIFNKWILIISILTTFTGFIFLLKKTGMQELQQQISVIAHKTITAYTKKSNTEKKIVPAKKIVEKPAVKTITNATDSPAKIPQERIPESKVLSGSNVGADTASFENRKKILEYFFPVLTEKEKKSNEKEKKRMVKLAAGLNQSRSKEHYSMITEPTDKSLPVFYMESGEVTNLEYRTFLFDLLINNRKEEFLIAKPDQSLWLHAAGKTSFDTLSKVYFSDRTYNSYPVVNITVAGAELYCAWLTQLANNVRQKDGKSEIEIRLPYEKEWLHAASVGHPGAVYPWFTESIQNSQNRFLANFCFQKQSEKFKQPIVYSGKSDPEAYTSAGMVLANRRVATIDVWSYNPNDFLLYGICGNASELVYADNAKTIKTKGGNWNSDFEHLKFNSEDEFTGQIKASPMIGFRVGVFIKK